MRHTILAALAAAAACSTPTNGSNGGTADVPSAAFDAVVGAADATATDAKADVHFDTADAGFACTDGDHGCFNEHVTIVCVGKEWKAETTCADGELCKEGYCAKPIDCTPGASLGCAGPNKATVCSADGKATYDKTCPTPQQCVNGACKTVACTPKVAECTGTNSFHVCADDGSGFGEASDCKTGAICLGGKCVSLCETNLKIANNVGCEYWSVDLNNEDDKNPAQPNSPPPNMIPHSVVVSNPGVADAEIKFTVQVGCSDGSQCAPGLNTCGKANTVCDKGMAPYELTYADNIVKAGGSKEFKMPVSNVAGSGISPKAMHLKSTQPVVAFQFNPFNSENATSNDGSLLLPQNTLGKEYFGVSWQSRAAIMGFSADMGYLTAVATVPGTTTISVTPTAAVVANPGQGVPQDGTKPDKLQPGKTYTFTLQQYQVLNLESAPPGLGQKTALDLTGTHLSADKPIAVFGGHMATAITDDNKKGDENFETCCTEHIEEQLMPLEAWGNAALCVKSKSRGYDVDHWVIVAGQAGVQLQTNPPVKGIDGVTLNNAGDFVHVQTDETFMLNASGKVEVVQFLVGSGQTQDKTGDPSMMLVPPRKQYRNEYVIQTADGYSTNWLTIVRPKGVDVKLDGPTLTASFQGFGDGSYEYAYVKVNKGTHTLVAAEAFGLMVYGYGSVTAYGYPGGMNLAY